jgi:hypothetical protein
MSGSTWGSDVGYSGQHTDFATDGDQFEILGTIQGQNLIVRCFAQDGRPRLGTMYVRD